jgi:septal ring factor EnvC (AmiA/AmiB activator)
MQRENQETAHEQAASRADLAAARIQRDNLNTELMAERASSETLRVERDAARQELALLREDADVKKLRRRLREAKDEAEKVRKELADQRRANQLIAHAAVGLQAKVDELRAEVARLSADRVAAP